MTEQIIFKGVFDRDQPVLQDFDFGFGVGRTSDQATTLETQDYRPLPMPEPTRAIEYPITSSGEPLYTQVRQNNDDDLMDREELLLKQQTAMMQKQIADAEKQRKINFTLKHDQLKDELAQEDESLAKQQTQHDDLIAKMNEISVQLDKLIEESNHKQ